MCKVSVIVPIFNAAEYLRNTLNSIILQNIKDIEVICVDDGSTDNSKEIVKEFQGLDKRVHYAYQSNSGAGCARNKGISLAKGEYIAFMDADDRYPNIFALNSLYSAAVYNKAVICGGKVQQNDGSIYEKSYIGEDGFYSFSDYQFDYLFHRFIYNREFLISNGILFPQLRVYEDPIFLSKALFSAGKFYNINDVVYYYSGSHQSTSMDIVKTKDYLRGITIALKFSSSHKLKALHKNTYIRFDHDASFYVEKCLYKQWDQELLSLLLNANYSVDQELIGIDDDYIVPALVTMWEAASKYMKFREAKPIHCFLKFINLFK